MERFGYYPPSPQTFFFLISFSFFLSSCFSPKLFKTENWSSMWTQAQVRNYPLKEEKKKKKHETYFIPFRLINLYSFCYFLLFSYQGEIEIRVNESSITPMSKKKKMKWNKKSNYQVKKKSISINQTHKTSKSKILFAFVKEKNRKNGGKMAKVFFGLHYFEPWL